MRQKRQSEIVSVVERADIRGLLGYKPFLKSDGRALTPAGDYEENSLRNTRNIYYTSQEMRGALGISSRFASSARLYGVLIGTGEVYGIYHTGERALVSSFNKEVLAFEEFCAILSDNGYMPSADSEKLESMSAARLSDIEMMRASPEIEEDGSEAEPSEWDDEDYDEYDEDFDSEAEYSGDSVAQRSQRSPQRSEASDSVAELFSEAVDVSEASAAVDSAAQRSQRIADINYTANNSEAVLFTSEAAQDRLSKWLRHYYIDSIIFGDGYEAAMEMIKKARDRSSILKPAPDTFRSMCYIPMDGNADNHLKLIVMPNWKKLMEHVIFRSKPVIDNASRCDGKVGDELWYNFCDLDLIRIRELLDYLREYDHGRNFPKIVIWAQSHHEDFLRSVFGRYPIQYKFANTEKLITTLEKVALSKKGDG